jgi:multiple sugar transport system permease protein
LVDATVDVAAVGGSGRVRSVKGWRRRGPRGSDVNWALAFLVPYAAVFVLFVVYPVGYGLWLGHRPASYAALFNDPIYLRTVVNTVVYLGVGVNLHLFGVWCAAAVGLLHPP